MWTHISVDNALGYLTGCSYKKFCFSHKVQCETVLHSNSQYIPNTEQFVILFICNLVSIHKRRLIKKKSVLHLYKSCTHQSDDILSCLQIFWGVKYSTTFLYARFVKERLKISNYKSN